MLNRRYNFEWWHRRRLARHRFNNRRQGLVEADRASSPSYYLDEPQNRATNATHPDNWDEPSVELETIEATERAETVESETMSTIKSTTTMETDVAESSPSEVTVDGLDETASGSAPSNPNTVTDRHLQMRASRFASIIFALLQPSRPTETGVDIPIRPSSV